MSAAPQKFSTLGQAQAAAQAQEDRLNGQAAFGNSQSAFSNPQAAFGNSQAIFANSQPSFVSQSASRTVGFGDASDQEIAEIRAGTYKETFDNNPEYNFRYKVADDTEQTYMAREEQRAGDTVTGSYQYVDPLGSLIVVNYSAGPGGYQETREVKPNFVTIKARPVRTQDQQTSRPSRPFTSAQRPQSNIVSQIVAQIQPLVSQTVTSTVGSNFGTPRFSSRPVAGGRTVTIRTRPGRTQFRQRTGRLQTDRPADEQTVSSNSSAQKVDAQKLDAQSQGAERQEAQSLEDQRLDDKRLEAQRLEDQRLESQRLEAQRLEGQRLEAQRLEAQGLEAQVLEDQRLEEQRLEEQRLEAETQDAKRQEAQKQQAASQAQLTAPAEAGSLKAQGTSSNKIIPGPNAPVLVASGSSLDLSSLFGQGGAYNVRFNTPDFNIEY